MRLLIVEDELDLAEALAAFLEKHQYIVDTVHDGRSGYDYASSGNYDAVILDIMLPQMDGIEVLKLLRAKGIATPVMMLTAKGRRRTVSRVLIQEPTTICPNPSIRTSCLHGCGPCCAEAGDTRPMSLHSEIWRWTAERASCAAGTAPNGLADGSFR